MSKVKVFWSRYEVPFILVGGACMVMAFLFTTFATSGDTKAAIADVSVQSQASVKALETKVDQGLKEVKEEQLYQRKMLEKILFRLPASR